MSNLSGTTAGGREWRATVGQHKGVRRVHVYLVGAGDAGCDCQWDSSPYKRNPRAPTRDDMQHMADDAERRYVGVVRGK